MENVPLEETTASEAVPFTSLISDSNLATALGQRGITVATKVQQAVIPEAISGKDLIVQAQTGSGKTFAFVIPLLLKVRAQSTNATTGLVITPTRELAIQVYEAIVSVAPDIHPACIIGGESTRGQIADLGEDRRIIIGTPGRLLDLIRRREILLRKCNYFVLDEADEMLSMGFLEDVRAILSRLPDKRQGLFISATITPRVQVLSQSFLRKPQSIVIQSKTESAPEIEHLYVEVGAELTAKAIALCDLIETQRPRATFIFCNTKSDTELVEVFLRRRGFDARRINSDLSQAQRSRIMAGIKDGSLRILIGTDVAARGIDVEQLDLVFNYALHEKHEIYIHRTGRTGRAGRSGRAISIVGPQDFGPFYNLKRKVTIELKKMNLPTPEEVTEARVAHFYELLRESGTEVTEKESTIARKLLKDLGDLDEVSDELLEAVAKLYRIALQALVAQEAKSLDNEGDSQGKSFERDGRSGERSRHHRGSSNRGHRRHSRR